MKKLENKTTLITGASSGIGKACAQYFAREGSNLVIMSRRSDILNELQNSLQTEFGVKVFSTVCDVRNRKSVADAFATIPASFKKIDILINNAGLASGLDFIQDGNPDDWDDMIDTNIKGLLYVTDQVIPIMIENKAGHIINLGSAAGQWVYPKGNVYCATKFAVKALSEGFRMDLLEYGIKVTSVDPGMVETNFGLVRAHGDVERAKSFYKGYEPLNADDIADTILFAATRPRNVNLNTIVMTPLAQANTNLISKKL